MDDSSQTSSVRAIAAKQQAWLPKPIQGSQIQWQQGRLLGSGTTGEVYEAINIMTAEMFVVKKIRLVHPY